VPPYSADGRKRRLTAPTVCRTSSSVHAEIHAHFRCGLRVEPVHETGMVRIFYVIEPDLCFALLHTEAATGLAPGAPAARFGEAIVLSPQLGG
jgi:hypothetical protein